MLIMCEKGEVCVQFVGAVVFASQSRLRPLGACDNVQVKGVPAEGRFWRFCFSVCLTSVYCRSTSWSSACSVFRRRRLLLLLDLFLVVRRPNLHSYSKNPRLTLTVTNDAVSTIDTIPTPRSAVRPSQKAICLSRLAWASPDSCADPRTTKQGTSQLGVNNNFKNAPLDSRTAHAPGPTRRRSRFGCCRSVGLAQRRATPSILSARYARPVLQSSIYRLRNYKRHRKLSSADEDQSAHQSQVTVLRSSFEQVLFQDKPAINSKVLMVVVRRH